MRIVYNDKLTIEDRKRIDGFYKSQKPNPKKIIPEPTKPVLKPKPTKKPIDVLSQPLSTIRELSQYLKVSMLTIKRWQKAGKIKAIRINTRGDRRFLREDIIEFLKTQNN